MPILNFHLVRGQYTETQQKQLLVAASHLYADVLNAPMDRIRVFVTWHDPDSFLVAGVQESEGHAKAPYFTFLMLQGRPLEERHRLLEEITDLVVQTLQVDKTLVRGWAQLVDPDSWAIGGVPATRMRKAEIEQRMKNASQGGGS